MRLLCLAMFPPCFVKEKVIFYFVSSNLHKVSAHFRGPSDASEAVVYAQHNSMQGAGKRVGTCLHNSNPFR